MNEKIEFFKDSNEAVRFYLIIDELANSYANVSVFEVNSWHGYDLKSYDEGNLYLIPTAEVPVTNLFRDSSIDLSNPKKYVCHTPCFRKEIGSYGVFNRGLLRQHQFDKVELVTICNQDVSYEIFDEMVLHASTILDLLGLNYRVLTLCSGDLGFSSAYTKDIEVYVPSIGHLEVSSVSNCEDFQARRINIKDKRTKKLAHTLNGSGLAIGRVLIAILEKYYNPESNTLTIPKILSSYFANRFDQ